VEFYEAWHVNCQLLRMRQRLLAVFGCLVWFFFMGCADDSSKSDMSREQFCQAWGKAACSSEIVSVCQAADADACLLKQQQFCLEHVPSQGFTGRNAQACISAVSSAYADADLTASELQTVFRLGAPCHQLVRGPRAEGQTCNTDAECNTPDGFACVLKGSAGGTCQIPRLAQPGMSCSAAQDVCTAGFFCNGENCVEAKPVGQACSLQSECASTAYCHNGSECVARLAAGSPCSNDTECLSGVCYDNVSNNELACLDRLRLSRADPACDSFR
jgi:hypothetical protein